MTNSVRHVTRKKYRQGMRSNARAYRFYREPGWLECIRDGHWGICSTDEEYVEFGNMLIKARDNGTLRRVLLEHGITQRWAVRRGRRGRRARK